MDENRKALLAYLAVCFFWGSTYLAIRVGVQDSPPLLFAGIRFIIAGALMLGYCKFKGYELPKDKSDITNMVIVGLLMLLCGNGLVVYAEQWVSSGIASLIIATVPLFMAIIEFFFLRSVKMDFKSVSGLLLGFGGAAYLILGDTATAVIDLKGLILLMLASLFWAAGSVHSKAIKFKGHIFANIGTQMFAGGIGLTIVSLIKGEFAEVHFTLNSVLALIYLIVFGSFVGYSCYIYILQKWTAAKAGTYAYVNPIVAIILGALLLGEPITISVVISMIVVIIGIVLVQSSKAEYIKEIKEK
ncbi:MAG: DMT(Drug/metabolite transporter) superfamily permease [Clostridia bacterium]|nr:DMT(Drug/metabolite transporter) superfamily permease [Clostridia bacterium]